jgi:hypothetical protein
MLSLSWQLTWPAVILDVLWSTFTNVILDLHDPSIELAFAIPYLLLVGPWLVRRMFERSYPGFTLKTLRAGAPVRMGHTEGFKLFWLLSWRVMVLMLALLLVVSFFLRFLKMNLSSMVPNAQEAPLFNAIGLTVVENAASLVLLPLVMPGMFAKRYQGFRVAAERKAAVTASVAKSGHEKHAGQHKKRS